MAISGGSLVNVLKACLIDDKELASKVQWAKWHVYFCDERLVPLDDADSNYGAFKKAVLDPLSHHGGHTCSLFPGEKHRYLIEESQKKVAWCHDSPKPPSDRITFTFPVISQARNIAFVAEGASKQPIMQSIFDNKDQQLPTALINARYSDKVCWFVDEAAFATVKDTTAVFKN